MRDAAVSVVSEVSHRDVVMYLIAIKSIYRFLGAGRIVVLNDGSLTKTDRDLLTRHLPFVRILTFRHVPIANTPKGGCWERLLLIAGLVKDTYVIQVDSDSLTFAEIPEVLDHIKHNRSFTLLGAGSVATVEPMVDACARAKHSRDSSMEPQAVSERSLDQFPDCAKLKYVRGNAAFAGFAHGCFSRTDVVYYSERMERICGSKIWHSWGSEQVTSNLIIANSARTAILPSPKYVSYYALPHIDYSESSFLHFMGTHRFEHGCYSNLARRVIRNLRVAGKDTELEFNRPAAAADTGALLLHASLGDDSAARMDHSSS